MKRHSACQCLAVTGAPGLEDEVSSGIKMKVEQWVKSTLQRFRGSSTQAGLHSRQGDRGRGV